ncbi:CPBP family intramembrane glutamic endopeptidase [Psittacicella hinzii]|nr:CPBP family intramembrane glutamic endopeptidase [Psittacicella hinzii]
MDTLKEEKYNLRFYCKYTLILYFALIVLTVALTYAAKLDTTDNQQILEKVLQATGFNFWIILWIALITPILEELVFRKYIISYLCRGHWFGVVVSVITFAAIHAIGNFTQMLAYLGQSIVLAYAFYRYRSLILCISIHVLNNSLALIALITGVTSLS